MYIFSIEKSLHEPNLSFWSHIDHLYFRGGGLSVVHKILPHTLFIASSNRVQFPKQMFLKLRNNAIVTNLRNGDELHTIDFCVAPITEV